MAKRKRKKTQQIINKALHRKLKIEQQNPTKNRGEHHLIWKTRWTRAEPSPAQPSLLDTASTPRAGRSGAAADCWTRLIRPVQEDLLPQQTA